MPHLKPRKTKSASNQADHGDITLLLRMDPERALQQMLSTYGGLVYIVVKSILFSSPREDIEECVSDTFLYVFEHRERLDFSKGSAKAYLCTAAKNRAYDRLRQMKRRSGTNGQACSLHVSAPSAEELALLNTDRSELIEAILALGEPDAKIIAYRYYLNMKSAEIAEQLGLKQNTVDQRARRALKKLARHFRKGESDAE